MTPQLDILALEPFYGGIRRSMLQAIIRCSRHRWTLLKLPARRMERRLLTASKWFAEQLSRSEIKRVDLVFAGEAMNLADFMRLASSVSSKPSVVYFHENYLPDVLLKSAQARPARPAEDGLDLANLSTAMAATEIWFNSSYHRNIFLSRASGLVQRHPELAGRNPRRELEVKSEFVPPPVDLNFVQEVAEADTIQRDPRTLFVDLRDANVPLLVAALIKLRLRREEFNLVTVGPQKHLPADFSRAVIHERDEIGQIRGLLRAGIFISTRLGATCDELLLKALRAGAWPVIPDEGFYSEILPPMIHESCLFDGTADGLCKGILNAFHAERPHDLYMDEVAIALEPFDAVGACRVIDERLDLIVRNSALAQESRSRREASRRVQST